MTVVAIIDRAPIIMLVIAKPLPRYLSGFLAILPKLIEPKITDRGPAI